MNPCEICYGHETVDCPYSCRYCALGNPCLGCADYDMLNDTCTSEGACGEIQMLIEGTPKENGWKYCPNCGAKMDEEKESDHE